MTTEERLIDIERRMTAIETVFCEDADKLEDRFHAIETGCGNLLAAHNDTAKTASEIQKILANYCLLLTKELTRLEALPEDVGQALGDSLINKFNALSLERSYSQEDATCWLNAPVNCGIPTTATST